MYARVLVSKWVLTQPNNLACSNKKVKTKQGDIENPIKIEISTLVKALLKEAEGQHNYSYKDKLLHKNNDVVLDEAMLEEDLNEELSKNNQFKEEEPSSKPYIMCPKVSLTNVEWEDWSESWKKTLVVKVLGKRINF